METVLFFVFGATALAGALGVVLARNPVHSALFLVQTLVSIAVYFVIQEAELLAAVQLQAAHPKLRETVVHPDAPILLRG